MVSLEEKEVKAIAHHRAEIAGLAEQCHNVEEGIFTYLDLCLAGTPLPDNRSPRQLAHIFCQFSAEFTEECDRELSPEEFRENIRRNACGMEPEQALLYVLALEHASSMTSPEFIDSYLSDSSRRWNADEVERRIRDICAQPGECPIEERIERIIDGLTLPLLSSPLLQHYDDALIDAAWDDSLKETLNDLRDEALDRAQQHAIHIAAFYIEVVSGRIAGISPQVPPEWLSLFYAATEEIWHVYAHLSDETLSQMQAETRIHKILQAVSAIFAELLILTLEGGTIAAVFATMMALDFAFGPAVFLTCAFAVVYISGMREFNWEVLTAAETSAISLERRILARRAKKQREALTQSEER